MIAPATPRTTAPVKTPATKVAALTTTTPKGAREEGSRQPGVNPTGLDHADCGYPKISPVVPHAAQRMRSPTGVNVQLQEDLGRVAPLDA